MPRTRLAAHLQAPPASAEAGRGVLGCVPAYGFVQRMKRNHMAMSFWGQHSQALWWNHCPKFGPGSSASSNFSGQAICHVDTLLKQMEKARLLEAAVQCQVALINSWLAMLATGFMRIDSTHSCHVYRF